MPYDLVGTVFPPILKAPAEAWSPVELTTVRGILPELTKRITRGELDIAVAETPMDKATDECLCMERLAWIGPCGGDAHTECPLPLSMVGGSCAFRAHVFKVLGERGIEWRTVFESGDIEAATTTVRTGLAVAAWLAPMVSADLDILGSETGPPELSMFAVNLLLPAQNVSMTVLALARCVHDGFSSRQRIGGRHAAQHVVSGYRLPPSIYMSPFGVSNASAEAGRATSDNSTYRLSSSKASHPNPWSPARMAGIFGRASWNWFRCDPTSCILLTGLWPPVQPMSAGQQPPVSASPSLR